MMKEVDLENNLLLLKSLKKGVDKLDNSIQESMGELKKSFFDILKEHHNKFEKLEKEYTFYAIKGDKDKMDEIGAELAIEQVEMSYYLGILEDIGKTYERS